jgi:hypothetical protein
VQLLRRGGSGFRLAGFRLAGFLVSGFLVSGFLASEVRAKMHDNAYRRAATKLEMCGPSGPESHRGGQHAGPEGAVEMLDRFPHAFFDGRVRQLAHHALDGRVFE